MMPDTISRRTFIKRILAFLGAVSPFHLLRAYARQVWTSVPKTADVSGGGEGEAIVTPDEMTRGAWGDYQIVFMAGPSGIAQGGSVRIDLPTRATFFGLSDELNWSKPQTINPYGIGFVSVSPAKRFAVSILTLEHPKTGNFSYMIKIVATEYIQPNETIVIEYRNARAQWITQLAYFRVFTDINGDGTSREISRSPSVDVKGGPARTMRIVIPSILGVGEEFDLKIAVLDELGFRANGYTGTVTFQSQGMLHNIPSSYTFTEDDESVHVFSGVSFQDNGIFTVVVTDGQISRASNPCVVFRSGPPFKIYWGDMHWHSNASDGLRSPREGYVYAKDISGLDFAVMTDHGEFLDRRGLWERVCEVADLFNKPGDFVTLHAYEWTGSSAADGGPGHKSIYYGEDGGPLFSYINPQTADPQALWQNLEDLDAVTVPHHVARKCAAVDWSYRNDDQQPLVEISSNHGNGEFEGAQPAFYEGLEGHYVQDALEMGHRLGFTAGSDCHYTLPGGNGLMASRGYWQGLQGLTAVYAPNLTRGAIFEQIRKRRTCATTGRRIVLWVVMNGSYFVGDELSTAYPPQLFIGVAAGRARIQKVEIVRNNETIHTQQPDSNMSEIRFTDKEFSDFPFGSTYYYYIRVTLEDTFFLGKDEFHHLAWSSPIWVTKDDSAT
jgi:hypothetical protein